MGAQGLEYQLASVKFTQGLDTRTEHKLVVPAKWNQLDNLTLSKDTSLRRRDGMIPLVATHVGNGLATYNKELLTVAGGAVSSISTAASSATSVSGRMGWVGVSKREIRRSTGQQAGFDCASGNGFTAYVWNEFPSGSTTISGVYTTLIDESTGTHILDDYQLVAGVESSPRVVFANNAFFYFWTAGNFLRCRVVATSAPSTVGTSVNLVNSANLAPINIDACAFATAAAVDTVNVVYGWGDGTTSVRSIQVTRAGTVPSVATGPTNVFTEANAPRLFITALTAVPFSSTECGIFILVSAGFAYSGTSGATLSTGWAVTSSANIRANPPPVNSNSNHITGAPIGGMIRLASDCQSSWGANASNELQTILVTTAQVQSGANGIVAYSSDFANAATDPAGPKGPYIAGKAFVSGSSVFLPVCILENYSGLAATKASNNQQNTIFIMEIGGATDTFTPAVVAKALYGGLGVQGSSAGSVPLYYPPCSVPGVSAVGGTVSSTSFILATTERTLLSLVGGFNFSSTGVVSLGLVVNSTVPPIHVQLGETTYFAGGVLSSYDGANLCEHGFNLFPEGISVEVVVGGGAMTAGAHQVVAIYEWIDNAGQRHQSAPSLAVTGTTAANDRLRVRVPTLHLTQKAEVRVILYMTQAAGLTFNRVDAFGTANDATVASLTLPLIDLVDASYASNELLYNQPNQAGTTLPNLAPPPCNSIGIHGNRLWLDAADQPGTFRYSQAYVNNLGLQFNESLAGAVDVSAGSIVGFAEMDEKMIIPCSRRLTWVAGTGPNAAGSFSNYSDPVDIPSDVGCAEARSILRMPMGIIFKSGKGWYLLGRGLDVRYIGEGVEDYDANSVCSAVLMEDRQECRFASVTGTQLYLSYQPELQWSTASMFFHPYLITDALYWPTLGVYVHISLEDGLNKDTPGLYIDQAGQLTARSIVTTARTSFLHMGEVEGFQRVRWLYLSATAPTTPTTTLNIAVAYNDDYSAASNGYNFDTALSGITFLGTTGTVDLRHKLRVQKCKSVAFTFTEGPNATSSVFLTGMQALAIQVGMKRGTAKLPATQSVG